MNWTLMISISQMDLNVVIWHNFEKLHNLSINIFEVIFYQEQDKWNCKLIPIENSKNESDRVGDFWSYKNHYVLIKNLNVLLGKQDCRYICKRRLKSYTSENKILKHKQQRIQNEKTSIRTSPQSHIYWNNHFHKSALYFRIYADFAAENEKEDSKAVCNNTTIIYKQNPVCNVYKIISELEDVLKSAKYESHLGYENVDWFLDEINKLENRMTFYFKKIKKDITMTQEDKEDFEKNNICQFSWDEILSDKVCDHCDLTGKNRWPAQSKCKINVKQTWSIFIGVILH